MAGILCVMSSLLRADVETVDGVDWSFRISNGSAIVESGSILVSAIPPATTGRIHGNQTLDPQGWVEIAEKDVPDYRFFKATIGF